MHCDTLWKPAKGHKNQNESLPKLEDPMSADDGGSFLSGIATLLNELAVVPRVLIAIGVFLGIMQIVRSEYGYVVFSVKVIVAGFAWSYLSGSIIRTPWVTASQSGTATDIEWVKLVVGLAFLALLFAPGRFFVAGFQLLK